MAKPTVSEVLNTFYGRFTTKTFTPDRKSLAPKSKMVSTAEKERLLTKTNESDYRSLPMGMSFMEYVRTIAKEIATKKLENERILEMAPEISQAASIMIPSIMAPNDLSSKEIKVICDAKELTEDQQNNLSKELTTYFNKTLNLSTAIPRWIEEAMYKSGSVPLLLVPLSSLEKMVDNDGGAVQGSISNIQGSLSTETFTDKIKRLESTTLYGISNKPERSGETSLKEMNEISAKIMGSLENFYLENPIEKKVPQPKKESYNRDHIFKKIKPPIDNLVKDMISYENLSISDNPDIIRSASSQNKKTKNKIQKATRDYYREKPVIFIREPEDRKSYGNPIFMDLPAESVIPLYTPGTPNDHIGYFIVLDDKCQPLSMSDFNEDSYHAQPNMPNKDNFTLLFQAFGYPATPIGDKRGQDTIVSIYQHIIEAHLKERVETAGFADVSLGTNPSIFKYLFSRYLLQKRSRIVFVPKELLVYFCFKTDKNGVGISKLEEVKFILSLRITLVICRMLAAFNNAIDRKKLTINFSKNFTGDLLENLQTAEREAIRKSNVTFSYDPIGIAQQVASKSFTIKATGIPGLEDYSIDQESMERGSTTIDNELADDIKNLLILSLDVPPAAMNSLSDSEYSRSIVTTNLFFSHKLISKQIIVEKHMSMFLQIFALYSSEVQSILKQFILDRKKEDKLDIEEPDSSDNIVDNIISSIKISLPKPNVAPDSEMFDILEKMSSSIDTLLTATLNDELSGGDTDLGQTISMLRSLIKSELIQKFMKDIGFSDIQLPDPKSLNGHDILQYRQALQNISASIKQQNKALNKEDDSSNGSTPDNFDQFNNDVSNPDGTSPDEFSDSDQSDTNLPDDNETDNQEPQPNGQEPNQDTSQDINNT